MFASFVSFSTWTHRKNHTSIHCWLMGFFLLFPATNHQYGIGLWKSTFSFCSFSIHSGLHFPVQPPERAVWLNAERSSMRYCGWTGNNGWFSAADRSAVWAVMMWWPCNLKAMRPHVSFYKNSEWSLMGGDWEPELANTSGPPSIQIDFHQLQLYIL